MFGIFAAIIINGIIIVVATVIGLIVITIKEGLELLGDALFDNPDAWLYGLLIIPVIFLLKLFR